MMLLLGGILSATAADRDSSQHDDGLLDGLHAYVTSAAEVRPDLVGERDIRARQSLGLSTPVGDHWSFDLSGALRHGSVHDADLDLHALHLQGEGERLRLELGRQVLVDPRGLRHLDGLRLERSAGLVVPALWLGRLWAPEAPFKDPRQAEDDAALGTLVGGASVDLHAPGPDGEPSGRAGLRLGFEEQLEASEARSHVFGAAELNGPRGGRGTLDAEAVPGEGQRLGLRAIGPVGRVLTLGPELRYEALGVSTVSTTRRDAMDWLGGDGYGVGSLLIAGHQGEWTASVQGGPVYRPDRSAGATGNANLHYQASPTFGLGLFGLSAYVEGSAVTGGGLQAATSPEGLRVSGDVGLYRFTPLTGAVASVGEARLRASAPLLRRTQGARETAGLRFQAELASGADRNLQPWMRGGVALSGNLGPSGDHP